MRGSSVVFFLLWSLGGCARDLDLTLSSSVSDSPSVTFVAFGVWGAGGDKPVAVAQAIKNYCLQETCEFVLTLGDNFYPSGVESTSDPYWDERYRDLYGPLGIPFYVTLGNHDMDGNEEAQIDYSQIDGSWRLPAENYSFVRPEGSDQPLAAFFVINNYRFNNETQTWLQESLDENNATWKILAMHVPLLSVVDHAQAEVVRNDPGPLQASCNKMDLYVAGHDHLFAHLRGMRGGCRIDQLVIGTGGHDVESIPSSNGRVLAAASTNGFGWFQITPNRVLFRFLGTDGSVLYSTTWTKLQNE